MASWVPQVLLSLARCTRSTFVFVRLRKCRLFGGSAKTGPLMDVIHVVILDDMKVVGAAELRPSLRKLARSLEKDGEPILLQVGKRQVGVIVSVKDFRERFALADLRTR